MSTSSLLGMGRLAGRRGDAEAALPGRRLAHAAYRAPARVPHRIVALARRRLTASRAAAPSTTGPLAGMSRTGGLSLPPPARGRTDLTGRRPKVTCRDQLSG